MILKTRTGTQCKNVGSISFTIATDKDDKENITLVGHKASAGYLNGFADPEYMGQLP
jgi:hypothetical protein